MQARAAPILGGLAARGDRAAVVFGGETVTYRELARMAGGVAAEIAGARRVAVLADASIDTCIACVGAVGAGVAAIPISPTAGERELAHIVQDSEPELLLTGEASEIPGAAVRAAARLSPGRRDGRAAGLRRRGGNRVHPLHLGNHRAAEGRPDPAPRDHLEPRRHRRGMGVDGT